MRLVESPASVADDAFWERARRGCFPSRRINLNPAALSAPSVPAREAIRRFCEDEIDAFPVGSYGRGREALSRSRRWMERIWPEVGAPGGAAAGATATLATLGTALYPALAKRTGRKVRVLMSAHEHDSARTGFERHAGFDTAVLEEGRETDPEAILEMVDALRPDVLFLSLVTYDLGRWLPVPEVLGGLSDAESPRVVIVNATQAVGIRPELPALGRGARIMFASGHKWLFAPPGTGLLWMTPEAIDLLGPYICVGEGLDAESPLGKFEPGGGQDFARFAGLEAALRLYAHLGPERVLSRSTGLARWFLVELDRVLRDRGIGARYYGAGGRLPDPAGGDPAGSLQGVFSAVFEEFDPFPLYEHLNGRRVHVKCIKKRDGDGRPLQLLRFGFPCYENLDRLEAAIREIQAWNG